MSHPSVAEAAVVAIPNPRWGERPLLCVVTKPGLPGGGAESTTHEAIREALYK
jgi:acyl-CoA synthetase (AMP-forming)/AMP-acid ligase II